jgi:hypothetical protein
MLVVKDEKFARILIFQFYESHNGLVMLLFELVIRFVLIVSLEEWL